MYILSLFKKYYDFKRQSLWAIYVKKNKEINLYPHPVCFFSPVLRMAGVFGHLHTISNNITQT